MSYELLRPDIWECIRRGGGYCPCAIIKDEESRCICKEFREGQETNCHCGVWRKHDDRAEDTNVPRKKGKSRAAMERETGISAATIYHYEMDGMEPTASRIIWLADYLT